MTPEEVWGEAGEAHCARWHFLAKDDPLAHLNQVVIDGADQAAISVIRTAMEAYAAEKVAEERALIGICVRAEMGRWPENEEVQSALSSLARRIASTNQHHGGNDAD